jgi:hypothetical protein
MTTEILLFFVLSSDVRKSKATQKKQTISLIRYSGLMCVTVAPVVVFFRKTFVVDSLLFCCSSTLALCVCPVIKFDVAVAVAVSRSLDIAISVGVVHIAAEIADNSLEK